MMINDKTISINTFFEVPFHSPLISPHTVAKTIVKAIKIPQEVKVNGPILLFPIP